MGDNFVSDQGIISADEVPERTSDKEGRPVRNLRESEMYDTLTGLSCTKMEVCQYIVKQ